MQSIIVVAVYVQPEKKQDIIVMLQQAISKIYSTEPNQSLIIMGDINTSYQEWITHCQKMNIRAIEEPDDLITRT